MRSYIQVDYTDRKVHTCTYLYWLVTKPIVSLVATVWYDDMM